MFLHAISVPALNKWTTVAPCINLVAAMQHFCNVVPEAFALAFPQGPQAESSQSEDEGAELGAPVDQTKVWRRLARKRQKKASHFLQDERSQWLCLLWAVLTNPVMVVHYKLFKHGNWYNERPHEHGNMQASSFRMAAVQASVELGAFLFCTDTVQVPAWLPLVGQYGPILSWSQDKLRATRRCILTILGQLWRKLLEPWNKYPWKLVGLSCLSEDLRERKAMEFFDQRICCLDCFSLKLRSIMGNAETLLRQDSLEFLDAVFDRVVPTSTSIERAFARMNRWCEKKGPKPQLSTLAAKHATYHFKNITERWREKCRKDGTAAAKPSNRARPDWVQGARKGRAANGIHMFAQAHRLNPKDGIVRQWRLLSEDERKHYASLARGQNLQSKEVARMRQEHRANSDALRGGFWDMSAPSGFCMAPECAQACLSNMRQEAEKFVQHSRSLRMEAPDCFDGAPAQAGPLWAACHPQTCPHVLPLPTQAYFQELHSLVLEIIFRRAPKADAVATEPLLLEFRSVAANACFYVAVAYHIRKKPIDAALLDLCVQRELRPEGVLMVLVCEKGEGEELPLLGDKQFCIRMASRASDWQASVLRPGPVRRMDHFDILSSETVNWDALRKQIEKEKDIKNTMAAFRKMQKKPAEKGQKRSGASVLGHKVRPGKKGRLHQHPDYMDAPGAWEGWGSSQSSSDSDSDHDVGNEEGSGGAERPLAMVEQRQRPKTKQRRGRIWGTNPAFQIAPIHAAGSSVPTGWGAICGLHTDPANPSLQCKKAMTKSGLSDEECQLRLKRWLVQGLDSSGWGSNKRESHVSLGGVQLSHFAEGLGEASLDRLVAHA